MWFVDRRALGLVMSCMLLGPAAGAATAADSAPLDGTEWVLVALAGRQVPDGPTATLQFDGGRLTGSDGCNRFSGSYSATGSAFTVSSELASTRMACPPQVEAEARAYLAALVGARAYRVDGARLMLLSADGVTFATLAAQSMLLKGTSWHATGINNGRQGVQSVMNGTLVTISFGGEGDASGTGGCNRYSGHYEVTGSSISIGKVAVTAMACADPPGVMEQEQAYFNALATAATVRFEGQRLELRTADGALAVSFERAPGG
jgi:heat shock protein HslJ